jgi:hypothetical protein
MYHVCLIQSISARKATHIKLGTCSGSSECQLLFGTKMVLIGWSGCEWLPSECKNAHFQAFPQLAPSVEISLKFNYILERAPRIIKDFCFWPNNYLYPKWLWTDGIYTVHIYTNRTYLHCMYIHRIHRTYIHRTYSILSIHIHKLQTHPDHTPSLVCHHQKQDLYLCMWCNAQAPFPHHRHLALTHPVPSSETRHRACTCVRGVVHRLSFQIIDILLTHPVQRTTVEDRILLLELLQVLFWFWGPVLVPVCECEWVK